MLGPKSKLRFILGACNSRDSTSPNEITPAHCVKVSLLMEVQESNTTNSRKPTAISSFSYEKWVVQKELVMVLL